MKKIISLLFLVIVINVFSSETLQNVEIPKDTKSDWMELKSGEWVRGEFKGLYSGKVEFDSEKFDLVKFEPNDISQIITQGNSVVSLNKEMPSLTHLSELSNYTKIPDFSTTESEVSGNLGFNNGEFIINLEDGSRKIIPYDNIASISAGEDTESNYWSSSLFVGVDILSGNTE